MGVRSRISGGGFVSYASCASGLGKDNRVARELRGCPFLGRYHLFFSCSCCNFTF